MIALHWSFVLEKEDRLHILTAKRMRDFVQKCDMKVHGGNSYTAVVIYFSQGQKKRYTSKAAGHEKGPSFLLRCEEVLKMVGAMFNVVEC